MYGYVMVSCLDTEPWCDLDAALSRISELGNFVRLNTRDNLLLHRKTLDAELSIRTEWARVQQKEPGFNLSTIIDVVSKRHTIWPVTGDFRIKTQDRKGKGKQSGKNCIGGILNEMRMLRDREKARVYYGKSFPPMQVFSSGDYGWDTSLGVKTRGKVEKTSQKGRVQTAKRVMMLPWQRPS